MKDRCVSVQVPASTTNLGPGFDCLGIALRLYNRVEVEPAPRFEVVVKGEGEGELPRDGRNLVVRGLLAGLKARTPPRVRVVCRNRIPLRRGLGSSAAAAAAGTAAGLALAGKLASRTQLLCAAFPLEGHPDNLAAAIFGGFTASTIGPEGPDVVRLRLSPRVKFRVVVPEAEVETRRARAVLPDRIRRADAVFNVGRAAALAGALAAGDTKRAAALFDDRLHQPYRRKVVPGLGAVLDEARKSGVGGVCLSGSGSALLVLDDELGLQRAGMATLMLYREGIGCRLLKVGVERGGMRIMVDGVSREMPD